MGCDQGGGFKDGEGRGGAYVMQDGKLTCSMGLEWMGIRTHAYEATTPTEGFFALKTHILHSCIFYDAVLTLYIFIAASEK
jgi:hypothetical protein